MTSCSLRMYTRQPGPAMSTAATHSSRVRGGTMISLVSGFIPSSSQAICAPVRHVQWSHLARTTAAHEVVDFVGQPGVGPLLGESLTGAS